MRQRLTQDEVFRVRPDGSNDNDGLTDSIGGAWKTLQYAYDWLSANVDPASYTAEIRIGGGTYNQGVSVYGPSPAGPSGAGNFIRFVGDTTTPSNVVINDPICCFHATYRGMLDVRGVKLMGGMGLYASAGGVISVSGSAEFGACEQYHMYAHVNGTIVVPATSYRISGGAEAHLYAAKCGVVEVAKGACVALTNTPAFSLAYALSHDGYVVHGGLTYTGSATGKRHKVAYNGVIDTGGGGLSYFPGDAAGIVDAATGGRYL